jgi:hypothetical protein
MYDTVFGCEVKELKRKMEETTRPFLPFFNYWE